MSLVLTSSTVPKHVFYYKGEERKFNTPSVSKRSSFDFLTPKFDRSSHKSLQNITFFVRTCFGNK